MRRQFLLFGIFSLLVVAGVLAGPHAASALVTAADVKTQNPGLTDAQANQEAQDQNTAENKFQGFGFSPALFVSLDTGTRDRVDTATIVGNPPLVRVTKDSDSQVGLGLEAHYFFLPPQRFLGIDELSKGKWGVGPFVGLSLGTNDIIQSVGVGVLLGLRRDAIFNMASEKPSTSTVGDSFNLGIGYSIDPNAQVLGAGFKENSPPPDDETQIRYRSTTQGGLLLVFSYTFNLL